MAPLKDASYFPSLDRCLTGDELLISWKSVSAAIACDTDLENDHMTAIIEFLELPEVTQLLSNPFNAFPEPTPQSKSAFETKTSAINVTPSSNTKHDIKQIKDDALWLSRTARLDEISALRVVVEECQARPAARLLGPFSEEELVGIREAAGNSRYSNPIPLSLLAQNVDPAAIRQEFEKEGHRRTRILQTYLSERRHVLKCSERLLYAAFQLSAQGEYTQGDGTGPESERVVPWLASTGDAIFRNITTSVETELAMHAISAIRKNVQLVESGSGWSEGSVGGEELEHDWVQNQVIEALHNMEIIWILITYITPFPSSSLVLAWFQLQQACSFFSNFEMEDSSISTNLLTLQSISMTISLNMLCLAPTMDFLAGPNRGDGVSADAPMHLPYIKNTTTVMDLHRILFEAADRAYPTAGPTILAWAYILSAIQQGLHVDNSPDFSRFERATSVDSEAAAVPDPYRETFDQIASSTDDGEIVEFLGGRAVNFCHVFEILTNTSLQLGTTPAALLPYTTGSQMRVVILSLLKYALGIGYLPELIQAIIATLTGGSDYWSCSRPQFAVDDVMHSFLNDPDMIDATVRAAQSRYPYESLPFLQLVRALAASPLTRSVHAPNSVLALLDDMRVFTYALPPHFAGYETAHEEENNNTIKLTQPVQLFESRSKVTRRLASSTAVMRVDEHFCIPADTPGRMISDSGPRVVYWEHSYPALKYFGKLLETYLVASDVVDATTGEAADRDPVSEMISIIATLLLTKDIAPVADSKWKDDARLVLENASAGLSRNRDITSVIFDIFEQELQNVSASPGSDASLEVLISCISFIHALIPVFPGRVWPLLARSGLLGVGRGGGQLSTIVEGVELVSGRYGFLTSCCRLYHALVDDFAANAVIRRGGVRLSDRFQDQDDVGTGIPEQSLSKVILIYTRYLVDVFESSCTWRYQDQDERLRLSLLVGTSFNKVLQYAYGIESLPDVDKSDSKSLQLYEGFENGTSPVKKQKIAKLMASLLPSANHIIDTFLSSSSGALRFQPLLRSYFDGIATSESTVYTQSTNLCITDITTLLTFSATLLQISKLLKRPSSQLESHLFEASPLIARLYAASDFYRRPVIALFEALIVTASLSAVDPPSILGHLGASTAKNLLQMLTDLDSPLCREENVTAIWHFLSMVVSSRQQWFATYLLSGKTPRDAMKSGVTKRDVVSLDKPLLTTALEKLTKINELSQAECLVMLEFISFAQSHSPWTICNAPLYPGFVKSISEFAGNLKPIQASTTHEESYRSCYQTRIAGHIAEILAMYLFHSRQIGSPSPVKDLKDNVAFFTRFAAAAPSYNVSLHSSLKRNFETRFLGCRLLDLKRTTLEPSKVGKNFFYDLELADKMLQSDPAWAGKNDDGLRMEVERANLNLSLVDAQVALFHSWKFLALELSINMKGDIDLERMSAEVVKVCLNANGTYQPPEEIFARLSLTRTDFALVLTQRLIQARSSITEVKDLLRIVWKTIVTLRNSFERAVPDDDLPYYRSLLKVLFLAVRVHAEPSPEEQQRNMRSSVRVNQSTPVMPFVLDIIKNVVSMGLREVASAVHDSPENSSPEDLSLITGILQSCLRIPGIELYYNQINNIMASNATPRVALTLFSWSDKLATDGDPIYGELSMLFLLELSRIPLMAEQLAIDGILGHIASASITSYLRRSGVSPFADSAGLQRCYSIWTKGILPLLLNIIDAVQASIATEVALFLNQFPLLLQQSEQALEAPETNRIIPRGQTKFITLTTCSESHSMALLTFILNGFRELLKGTTDIPAVKWDAAGVLENVDFWLSSRALLRERLLPLGEREVAMVKKKNVEGKTVSELENKVVLELMGIRDVLSNGNDS